MTWLSNYKRTLTTGNNIANGNKAMSNSYPGTVFMENKVGFHTDELYYMRSSRKHTAWVWTRVFCPSTQDNSFPCSHSPQRTGTPDTLASSLPTVEKWKRKKERIWTLILPSRPPCLSQVSFTSASFHEKFLRGDTAKWEAKTSSHSLVWQKVWPRERKTPCQPTTRQ